MQFQNDSSYDMPDASPETPKMIGWLIKYSGGLITDKKQAALVLVAIAIFSFFLSVVLFFASIGGSDTAEPPVTPEIENAGAPQYM